MAAAGAPPDALARAWIRHKAWLVPTGVVIALAVVMWVAISFVSPGLAHTLLEGSLGHPGEGRPTDAEIDHVALGLTWVLWLLAVLAVAAALRRKVQVTVGAAGVIAFALYLLGTIPNELVTMAADTGSEWPTPDQAAFASALAGQILAVVLLASVVLVALRGDWSTFAISLIGFLAIVAVWLGIITALEAPFKAPEEAKRGEISVDGAVVGAPLDAGQEVSVVFVIQKRNEDGEVTSTEHTTRDAVAGAPADCELRREGVCRVQLLVKRGDGDATIAQWFADREAASAIFVIGPTGVPPSEP